MTTTDEPMMPVGALDPCREAELPLVSVIIVNFNYGRFLRAAIGSALGQTYPRVECIVVDNGSTDESAAVLSALEADDPDLTIIRRPDNGWQTRASLDGLAASAGAYVVFMDADDILLPDAIDMHMFAHLSLRQHVGFTSGDMLQMQGGQVVVASGRDFNAEIERARKAAATAIRVYRHPDGAWPGEALTRRLEGRIHLVASLHDKWVWSPTTGNCFRRDAVLLFTNDDILPPLRTGTDLYLARGIGALCGSALVDQPVFVYRIHGGNIYSRRAQLHNATSFSPGSSGDSNDQATLLLIDHLVTHADRFVLERWLAPNFVKMLLLLDCLDPDDTLPHYARRSRLARRVVEHAAELVRLIGRGAVVRLMLRKRVPPRLVLATLFPR